MARLLTYKEFHHWLERRPHGWVAPTGSAVNCPLARAHRGLHINNSYATPARTPAARERWGTRSRKLPKWMAEFVRRVDSAGRWTGVGIMTRECLEILDDVGQIPWIRRDL